MKKYLAIAGLVLMPMGFVIDKVDSLPFVDRWLAPDLTTLTEGFETMRERWGDLEATHPAAQYVIEHWSTPLSEEQRKQVVAIRAGTVMDRFKTHLSITLATNTARNGFLPGTVTDVSLIEPLQAKKAQTLLWIGIGIFCLGFFVELAAFFLESDSGQDKTAPPSAV